MKTFKTILITFLTLATLTGCNNDDDDGVDPNLDTDGDGVADINDLCPNEVGTFIDDGCFLVTNINLTGDHSLTFLQSIGAITATVAGVPVTGNITVVGDTFQLTIQFREDGTFTIDGQYRIVTTIILGGDTMENSEILVFDNEAGTYTADANAETITFSGVNGFSDTWNVTEFNQGQLTITNATTETTSDGALIELSSEIRLVRI